MEGTGLIDSYDGIGEIDKVYKRVSKFGLNEATKAVLCAIIIRKHHKSPKLIINELCRLYDISRDEGGHINRIASKLGVTNGRVFNTLVMLIQHVYSADRTIGRSSRVLDVLFLGNYTDIKETSIQSLCDTDKSANDILIKLKEIKYLKCPICGKEVAVEDFSIDNLKCKECKREGRSKKTQKLEEEHTISQIVYELKGKEPERACSKEAIEIEQVLHEFISEASSADRVHLYLVLKEEIKQLEGLIHE